MKKQKKVKTPLQQKIAEARVIITAYSHLCAHANTLLSQIQKNPNWGGLKPDVVTVSAANTKAALANLEAKVTEDALCAEAMYENLGKMEKRLSENVMWETMKKTKDLKPLIDDLESEIQTLMDMARSKRERDAAKSAAAADADGSGALPKAKAKAKAKPKVAKPKPAP